MLRGAANFAESNEKLQQIQRELKARLQRAREVVSNCSLDDALPKTQEELYTELEQLQVPAFDPKVNYNHQYWRTYLENEINTSLLREATDRKQELTQLVTQIEVQIDVIKELQDQHYRLNRLKNRKKNRRLATQIQKSYLCPYSKCQRIYGSDVSLNLHIKLKHNGGNKTDRQKLAEKICMAEQNNEPPPQLTLNLPPGYLREYRRLYFQREYSEPVQEGIKEDESEEKQEIKYQQLSLGVPQSD